MEFLCIFFIIKICSYLDFPSIEIDQTLDFVLFQIEKDIFKIFFFTYVLSQNYFAF